MNKIFVILLMAVLPMVAQAQRAEKIRAERIKANADYIWGEGTGKTMEEADQNALNNLMSRICVRVEMKSDTEIKNQTEGNEAKSSVDYKMNARSFSTGTLNNTGMLTLSQGKDGCRVMRYMTKSDLEKTYAEIKNRVCDWVRDAKRAEAKGRIDDALRYYYWASCLLQSLQHPADVMYKDDDGEYRLMDFIPEEMSRILETIKPKIAEAEGEVVNLMFNYNDKPLTSLEFRYYDGRDWQGPVTAKNGISEIEVRPGYGTESVKLRYEYEFKKRADAEVLVMMDNVPPARPRGATVEVKQGKKKEVKAAQAEFQAAVAQTSEVEHAVKVDKPKELTKIMNEVVTAVRKKTYDAVRERFTEGGYAMFDTLIHYGKATVLGEPKFSFWEMGDHTVCRSVPMKFAFARNGGRSFVENVTFTFNKDQRIETVAFGLDQAGIDDIFNHNQDGWNDSVRMVIASFLENYQTAYALKRLDYIQSIFDDDAIIITGTVMKRQKQPGENTKSLGGEYVKLTRQDKKSYLEKLRVCFDKNEYVNLHFSDLHVQKSWMQGFENTYGMLIQQDYYSSNYADKGYLFLWVDMAEVDKPVIKIRTWQPRRDYDITPTVTDVSDYYRGLINSNIIGEDL